MEPIYTLLHSQWIWWGMPSTIPLSTCDSLPWKLVISLAYVCYVHVFNKRSKFGISKLGSLFMVGELAHNGWKICTWLDRKLWTSKTWALLSFGQVPERLLPNPEKALGRQSVSQMFWLFDWWRREQNACKNRPWVTGYCPHCARAQI